MDRAGIPAYFVRGVRRPDPAGRAFLALLGCAVERLSARAFAEYLSLSQVPRPQADGAPPTTPPQWVAPQDLREDEALPDLSVTLPAESPAAARAAAAPAAAMGRAARSTRGRSAAGPFRNPPCGNARRRER